mmetsp:Transcript_51480/g.143903  ORF Transcript_51480/g.143903 Transcript_51480/m.143903 type:complete len:381 (-) Transcript_51480:76-1218(-)
MAPPKATSRRVRKHGFEPPFHPIQVLSWVVFGCDVVVVAGFCVPLLDGHVVQALIGASFGASIFFLVLACACATCCDPRVCFDNDVEALSPPGLPEDRKRPNAEFCKLCNQIAPPRSKHCRDCDKCIEVFDHHCMWLNNCIGGRNYRWFLVTICAVAAMTGVAITCCCQLLVECASNGERIGREMQRLQFETRAVVVVLVLVLVVNLPLFVLDMELIVLHMFLARKKLTTWEYIIAKKGVMDAGNSPRAPSPGQGAFLDGEGPAASGFKAFPRCVDWIVYRPRKRRKPPKDRPVLGDDASMPPAQDAGLEASSSTAHNVEGETTVIDFNTEVRREDLTCKPIDLRHVGRSEDTPLAPRVSESSSATGWQPVPPGSVEASA